MAIPLLYAGIILALAGLWLGQLVGWNESNVALLPASQCLSDTTTVCRSAWPARTPGPVN